MSTHFELLTDDRSRVSFYLYGDDGEVLLRGLPCRGKIDAQTEVMHTRQSLAESEHLVPHVDESGRHFVVLKDDDGTVLARSRHVATPDDLEALIGEVALAGAEAPIIDKTRR